MKLIATEDKEDGKYLRLAEKIAKQHIDKTRNMGVGAIIVKDGIIVGRGYRKTILLTDLKDPYHEVTFHAEHLAITEAGNKTQGATLYCTLEPCSHRLYDEDYNTPRPCCELIYEAGIKRVVMGIPDKDFGGGGTEFLLSKGVEVVICKFADKKLLKKLTGEKTFLHEIDEKSFKDYFKERK